MIGKLRVVVVPAMQAATVYLQIPRSAIEAEIDPAIREVLDCLSAQGFAPAGPLFAHHHAVSDTQFDFDVGFPTSGAITPCDRVHVIELDAIEAALVTYTGPYEGLYEAWTEFGRMLDDSELFAETGQRPQGNFREVYRIGPESGKDSRYWETDLTVPLNVR